MKFQLERYPNNENPQPILVPRKEIQWEGGAVFNPTVINDSGVFRMLYRTYPKSIQEGSPRLTRPGFYLKNQVSYIGYAESRNGIDFERKDAPFISPDTDYDRYGCEDPRMTKIGDTFYIMYTAIDKPLDNKSEKANIRIALATTKDFITVTKHGIIGPDKTSKAAALFPEKVSGGKIGLILTISSDSTNSHVAVRYYNNIESLVRSSQENWADFLINSSEAAVLKAEQWLHRGPELGAAPIKTEKGWLLIFSTESMSDTWTVSGALLDLEQPHKLIARTPGYLLQPVASYEREGLVPNVTFPEGAVIVDDNLYVYYGCADTVIGLATCKLKELLEYIGSFRAMREQ